MHTRRVAPPPCCLQASFGNGRVEEFLLDQNLSAAYMRTPKICACIGAAIACFHFTSLPRLPKSQTLNPTPIVWQRVRRWAEYVIKMCTAAEIEEYGLQEVQTEVRPATPWTHSRLASYSTALLQLLCSSPCQNSPTETSPLGPQS